jgi:gamma-glutamylputrescine oxidase
VKNRECFKLRHDVKPVLSWYEATAQRGPAYETLRSRVDVDVCVIGGGLAGLTTALEAQRRGLRTVLIEGARVVCAASGRNGGFVSSGFALGLSDIVKQVGLPAARALYDLSREGTEYVRATLSWLTHGFATS